MSATKPKGYTVADWRGTSLYVCARCSFDTFEVARMREHNAQPHPKPSRIGDAKEA